MAENRILKHQIKGRLLLSEAEKATLAEIAHRLRRKALEEVAATAQPDRILGWHRELIANKFDGSKSRRRVGRPRIDEEIERLVVQMAKGNPGWGYDRIAGALANLGHVVSGQTVGNILRRHGLSPAPKRKQVMSWKQTAKGDLMKLTQQPEIATWPETHYVFIEKIGPFQNTAAQAWKDMHQLVPGISEHNKITGYMSLYKVGPKIYRAGVSLAAEPKNLPENLKYDKFKGGKYSRFVLTGPYSDLPEASGRVFEIVSEKKIQVRDDYCIENYVNDPRTTPEQQLVTEILVPAV